MRVKGFNTTKMNFLHTRLRVLTKLGGTKTAGIQLLHTRLRVLKNLRRNTPGKALPTATPANRRGVPRPDPRRETGKTLPTTTPAYCRGGPRPVPGRDPTTEQTPAAPPPAGDLSP